MVTDRWVWIARATRYLSIVLVVTALVWQVKWHLVGITSWTLYAGSLAMLVVRALWRRSLLRALHDGLVMPMVALAGGGTVIAAVLMLAPFVHSFEMHQGLGMLVLGCWIAAVSAYLFELMGMAVARDD